MATKALVIGFGSIGRRHVRNLAAIDASAEIDVFDPYTANPDQIVSKLGLPGTVRVVDSIDWKQHYDLGFVCTPTSTHIEYLEQLLSRRVAVFVEKPIAGSCDQMTRVLDLWRQADVVTMVGCNFRFHPAIAILKDLIDSGEVTPVSVLCEFGQYLPDWRPGADYRAIYSAKRALGGGVVLDRIHEFDYLKYLLGDFSDIFAMGGKLSDLEIDTEDVCDVLIKFASGVQCSLHLDYLQHYYCWRIKLIGNDSTATWDFGQGSVSIEKRGIGAPGVVIRLDHRYDINQMYVDQMKYFLKCAREKTHTMNEIDEAYKLLQCVEWTKESFLSQRPVRVRERV